MDRCEGSSRRDLHYHLLATQERISDELARTQCDFCHGCGSERSNVC